MEYVFPKYIMYLGRIWKSHGRKPPGLISKPADVHVHSLSNHRLCFTRGQVVMIPPTRLDT